MKKYLILLPLFILSIFQGTFFPLNLVLLLILFLAITRPAKETLLIAFTSGIFLDLANGSTLGYSSILLLISSFLVILYSRRLDVYHPFFLPAFVLITAGAWSLVTQHFFNWPRTLILAVLAYLIRVLAKILPLNYDGREGRLKL